MSNYIQKINNDNLKSGPEKVLDKCVRRIFSRKGILWVAVFVLILILIALTAIAFAPTKNKPAKNTRPIQTWVDPCAAFPPKTGEITCQEAKSTALAKYAGEIIHIDLKNEKIQSPTGTPPKLVITQKEVWLLTIQLKEPISPPSLKQNGKTISIGEKIGTIELAIDKTSGKIIFYRGTKT